MDISRQIITYVRKFKFSDLQGSMPDTPCFILFSFGYLLFPVLFPYHIGLAVRVWEMRDAFVQVIAILGSI